MDITNIENKEEEPPKEIPKPVAEESVPKEDEFKGELEKMAERMV